MSSTHGLEPWQVDTMRMIHVGKQLLYSKHKIADQMRIDSLERSGLVRLLPTTDELRHEFIMLTDKGLEAFEMEDGK